jgi:hypothetical protein
MGFVLLKGGMNDPAEQKRNFSGGLGDIPNNPFPNEVIASGVQEGRHQMHIMGIQIGGFAGGGVAGKGLVQPLKSGFQIIISMALCENEILCSVIFQVLAENFKLIGQPVFGAGNGNQCFKIIIHFLLHIGQ